MDNRFGFKSPQTSVVRKSVLYVSTGFTLLAFMFYWLSTLLYVTPNNYIRIQFDDYLRQFELIFFQRWAFFAPPPKSNLRLYYTFTSRQDDSTSVVYEALKPVTKAKQEKAPFNAEEETLDYILSGSASSLRNALYDQVQLSQVVYPDSSDAFHTTNAQEIVDELGFSGQRILAYTTLKNYARLVAQRQGLALEDYRVQILLAEEDIVPFSRRNDPEEEGPAVQKLLFKTRPLDLTKPDS